MCKRFDRSCIFNGRYGSILPSLYTGMRSLTLPQEKRVVFPSETLTAGAETRSNEGIPPLRMPHRNFCAHAVKQKRKKNQWSCVLLQAMIRNAEVRFVFRGRIKESDQVLGMSDPGARAERGQSSPERSALKVENHQDFRPHRAVPEADGDEMPLEPDGPSVLLPRKTSSPAHFVLKAKRSCPTNPHFPKKTSPISQDVQTEKGTGKFPVPQ